jgi:hypothetical protein
VRGSRRGDPVEVLSEAHEASLDSPRGPYV